MRSIMKDMRYSVIWSVEDREWVATVEQFPSLSCLDPDPGIALSGLVSVVGDVVRDMAAKSMEPEREP